MKTLYDETIALFYELVIAKSDGDVRMLTGSAEISFHACVSTSLTRHRAAQIVIHHNFHIF